MAAPANHTAPTMSVQDLDEFELVDASDTEDLVVVDHERSSKPTDTPALPKEQAGSDPDFIVLLESMQNLADRRPSGPIFFANLSTSSNSLFDFYLSHLPERQRSAETCTACRNFVEAYGSLCTVRDDGSLQPLVWSLAVEDDGIASVYKEPLAAIAKLFTGSTTVAKEFRISTQQGRSLGKLHTKNPVWSHFHITLKDYPLTTRTDVLATDTAYEMLTRILADNTIETINQAHHLLHTKLPYATSHKPAINWLQDVAVKLRDLSGDESTLEARKRNLTTRLASSAWIGCLSSLRQGVIGALLEDIAAALEYETIKAHWEARANSANYLRPVADPSVGNIQVAEKAMTAMGITDEDLKRYYMTTNQIPEGAVLWKDAKEWNKPDHTPGEIFGGLKAKIEAKKTASSTRAPMDDNADPTPISFRKFAKTVLPQVKSMELEMGDTETMAFFTSGKKGSTSPFVWASESNTASWYYWLNPHNVTRANIHSGWNEVLGIVAFPHMWEHISAKEGLDFVEATSHNSLDHSGRVGAKWPHARQGVRYLVCLKNAKEQSHMGWALFPEFLKGTLHGVRKSVEALSNSKYIEQPILDMQDGEKIVTQQVGGMAIASSQALTSRAPVFRVFTNKGIKTRYKITLYD